MNNHMKFLIGTACFCVIGLTAWFVISEVRSNQRQQSFAMWTKCQLMLDDAWRERNYPDTPESQQLLDRDIDSCRRFILGN